MNEKTKKSFIYYSEVLTHLNNDGDLFYDSKRVAQIERSFDQTSIMIRLEGNSQFTRVHCRSLTF